jgi:hypothetical protein
MRRPWGVRGGVLAWSILCGCGARTGFDEDLEVSATDSDAGTRTSPGTTGGTGNNEEGILCAFNVGTVLSCDVPASDGAVQRCGGPFRYCVSVGGQWGCCVNRSGNNGSGGSCRFPGQFDDCE